VIRGLDGDDILVGDPSRTTVDYSKARSSGVHVDLALGTASGGEDDDTLSGMRNIIGSRFADVLRGDEHKNQIFGGDGDDQLFGKTNDDTLVGQAGNDSADGGIDVDSCSAESEVNCELN
jgi:Ca2+-binding RTX toxin-like protein